MGWLLVGKAVAEENQNLNGETLNRYDYRTEEIPVDIILEQNITAYGMFADNESNPISNATVLILNNVPGTDIFLNETKTNSTGYFNITITIVSQNRARQFSLHAYQDSPFMVVNR